MRKAKEFKKFKKNKYNEWLWKKGEAKTKGEKITGNLKSWGGYWSVVLKDYKG